jgi:homoserine O-acetyltransferase
VAPTYEGDFVLESHLLLECGRTLVRPVLHYAVYGRLNAERDNAVLVCHALSGSALVGAWWPGLFGQQAPVKEKQILRSAQDDKSLEGSGSSTRDGSSTGNGFAQRDASSAGIVDLESDCVICVNLLGSCYGSTGPGSVNPEKADRRNEDEISLYGPEFPLVSIRDNVRAQAELIGALGIERLKLAIGGSIGGMQALEWAILFPERVERAVVIGVAPLNAMGLALNHLQRRAIQNDPEWLEGWYLPHRQPRRGLALARQIAMLSYKSPELFAERFGRNPNRNGEDPWGLDSDGGGLGADAGRFDVAGFLDYQGERFPERFDANAYLAILRTMDTWDPMRGWRSATEAYGRIEARLTFVGISSDALFPAAEVKALAEAVRGAGADAEYREMVTAHGHDAFLAEQGELVRMVKDRGEGLGTRDRTRL